MKKQTYTTFDIARILDVYPVTVANWIDGGKLKAFSTPGGHRRVLADDLAAFLKQHDMPRPRELKRDKQLVLVVDDDPLIVRNVGDFLKSQDKPYEVHTAVDGYSAGEAVAQLQPDLVILDIKLPGLDGIAVCKRIKQQYPDTRIIAITAYGTPENKEAMIKAGADAFVNKPFRLKALMATIQDVVA